VAGLGGVGTGAAVTTKALDPTGLSPLARERHAYRRSRARRSTLVALASTLVFAAAVVFGVTSSPGWPRVQDTFLDLEVGWSSLPDVLAGLWLNVRVLVVAEIGILVLGLVIAVLRTLRGPVFFPLRALATGYVDLFRGVPLLIALYLIGFGLPALRLQGVPTDVAVLGTITLILVYSAYVAEVFRAGIESVHPSQRAAARSLGLTHRQSMRLVILPQAVRRVLPPLLNDFVALQKDVGLISVLGAVDAIRAAQIASARTFDFTPYVLAALLFVLLAIPTGRIADAVAARAARREGLR
jgi:polar amino acid transport system permease protein